MSPFLLFILFIIICAGLYYGYGVYRTNRKKQTKEKKRNLFNDRV